MHGDQSIKPENVWCHHRHPHHWIAATTDVAMTTAVTEVAISIAVTEVAVSFATTAEASNPKVASITEMACENDNRGDDNDKDHCDEN